MMSLEVKEILCVVVADILDHLVDALSLITSVRDHAVLDIVTYEVTEDTTEVLMTRIREERTAIGKHTYEAREETEY